ncbi:hypothetical protein JFQ93_002888 [Aeromonas sobria]|nr:hypothetical protein [Aeromonas sobria]
MNQQSIIAGNKQQTGGCNSGAVALPDEIDKQVAISYTLHVTRYTLHKMVTDQI